MACWNEHVLCLHIPKTAGISCRQYINDWSPDGTAYQLRKGDGYVDHLPLRHVEGWTGRRLDSFELIVAVVRNPFEHALSQWWHWRDGYARGGLSEVEMTAALANDLTSWLVMPYSDYPTYYEAVLYPRHASRGVPPQQANELQAIAARVRQQGYYEWWLRLEDEIPDNVVVIPFHEVNTRFPEVVRPFMVDGAPAELDHRNKSRARDMRQYQTLLSIEIIEARYRWAFEQGWFARWPREDSGANGT